AICVGIGIGCTYVHTITKVMEAARAGEESVTASSISTLRSLGQAFGSAIAGAVANTTGLDAVASADAVRTATAGVYLVDIAPVLLTLLLVVRFFRVR
ncbi:MAG TPA: hypothetical protein VK456_12100, partial [Xanthobacteraceae bacterium]|nr:hypothetical protein [Xanthobacteraceae bacterium]